MTNLQQLTLLDLKLAVAQIEHGNGSPEAEAIRDEMDIRWKRLKPDEIPKSNETSQRLNAILSAHFPSV